MNLGERPRTVVLVEGESDRQAVLALAERLDRDLAAEGVVAVAMGGITNIETCMREIHRVAPDVELAGLYDIGEQRYVASALGTSDLVAVNFFACDADLEQELIRALGHDAMLAFIESQGELRPFRTMQKQPAQRERSVDQHLHRFCGIRAGRKARYARGMVEWLDIDKMPPPLDALLRTL